MSSRSTRGTARTLRGVWSRRWTLVPLLVLTVVVVAGTVTVLAFADAAGTSRLLALPLLLLGLVAVPGTARELAGARRGEVALARLRGLQGVSLTALLMAEPLVVLVVGGVLGLLAGLVGAHLAAAVWAGGAGHVGWSPLLAGGAVVLVALAAVTLGMVAALREPLVQQVSPAARPRAASVLAAFGQRARRGGCGGRRLPQPGHLRRAGLAGAHRAGAGRARLWGGCRLACCGPAPG